MTVCLAYIKMCDEMLAYRELSPSTGPSFLFTFLGVSSISVAFQIIRCTTRGFWRDDVLFTSLYVCIFFPDHFRRSEHLLCSLICRLFVCLPEFVEDAEFSSSYCESRGVSRLHDLLIISNV